MSRSLLARYLAMKKEELKPTRKCVMMRTFAAWTVCSCRPFACRRPWNPEHCNSVRAAEHWRREVRWLLWLLQYLSFINNRPLIFP